MKNISIIGSTGSIGTQALDVVREGDFAVCALAAGRNAALLEQQARAVRPQYAVLADEKEAKKLKTALADTSVRVMGGEDAVCAAAALEQADLILNAAVGIAGLRPTLAAIETGKTLALANKESLVCGGELVMARAKARETEILPVDSEHSAIFQALRCGQQREVSRLILTASGGPFFGKTQDEMKYVTPEQALRHPSWSMGAKITIDSSTMMNKGFEVIEARWLFDIPENRIDVVVHRESIVHSMVEFCDGTVAAICSPPDMRLPIQLAMTWPERRGPMRKQIDFTVPMNWSFSPPDRESFPALALCGGVLRRGGNLGAVLNGANEEAVALFLQQRIGYCDIVRLTAAAVEAANYQQDPDLNDIFESDCWARGFVRAAAQCGEGG